MDPVNFGPFILSVLFLLLNIFQLAKNKTNEKPAQAEFKHTAENVKKGKNKKFCFIFITVFVLQTHMTPFCFSCSW